MNRTIKECSIGLMLFVLSLAMTELGLREISYPYWMQTDPNAFVQNWRVKDETLGWVNKPGVWTVMSLNDGKVFKNTFLSDGSRDSGSGGSSGPRVAFFGDSYVLGYGLADEDTAVSFLQSQFKEIKFQNFGVAGYGTNQSLLLMKRILSNSESLPAEVFYLLNSFHEQRNTGNFLAIRRLVRKTNTFTVPYVSLDAKENLVQNQFAGQPYWELCKLSSLVCLIDELFYTAVGKLKVKFDRKVTQKLLLEMANLAKDSSVKFKVIIFDVGKDLAADYKRFLDEARIGYTDCSKVGNLGKEFRLSDGHPNKMMNIELSKCIANDNFVK